MTLATLRKLEWRGTVTDPNGIDFYIACPLCKCGAKRPGETPKHAPDCELDAAIREAERRETGAVIQRRVNEHLAVCIYCDQELTTDCKAGAALLAEVALWRKEAPTP